MSKLLLGQQPHYRTAKRSTLLQKARSRAYFPYGGTNLRHCSPATILISSSGEAGSQLEVKGVSGCRHKRFRTRSQAEAFIKDWQDSYADACRWELRQALKQGGRFETRNVKVNVPKLYGKAQADDEGDGVSGCLMDLEKLEM